MMSSANIASCLSCQFSGLWSGRYSPRAGMACQCEAADLEFRLIRAPPFVSSDARYYIAVVLVTQDYVNVTFARSSNRDVVRESSNLNRL
jgi:hypothetical protein